MGGPRQRHERLRAQQRIRRRLARRPQVAGAPRGRRSRARHCRARTARAAGAPSRAARRGHAATASPRCRARPRPAPSGPPRATWPPRRDRRWGWWQAGASLPQPDQRGGRRAAAPRAHADRPVPRPTGRHRSPCARLGGRTEAAHPKPERRGRRARSRVCVPAADPPRPVRHTRPAGPGRRAPPPPAPARAPAHAVRRPAAGRRSRSVPGPAGRRLPDRSPRRAGRRGGTHPAARTAGTGYRPWRRRTHGTTVCWRRHPGSPAPSARPRTPPAGGAG